MGESFRAGVGAVIVDAAGRVLAFDRADVEGPAWQLPQGGLRRGEDPQDGVFREVLEETGLAREDLTLLGRIDEPLAYELPAALRSRKTGRGQAGYWFFFRLAMPDARPQLPDGGEFRAWRKMDFEELIEATVDFRKAVYRRLAGHLQTGLAPER